VGASGSGKTTILRAIAGLYSPTRGQITLDEEVWLDTQRGVFRSPQQRRVGLVFQDYALFPHLTALANIEAALGHLPRGARRARAGALLEQVNMSGLEDRRPDEMSGGQRQRIAVARALARDPAFLLLDEPFSAVDQVTRRRLQGELNILHRSIASPTIFVTHDLREATNIASRIAVIQRGSILQAGPPAEIFARPASPTVARLLDHSNVFDATVTGRSADGKFTILDWCGQSIEARINRRVQTGDRVNWFIPQSSIVLHRRGRPSLGERENPVSGTVEDILVFGDQTQVILRAAFAPELPLIFSVSTHAANRNGIDKGVAAAVSLIADDIHIMETG